MADVVVDAEVRNRTGGGVRSVNRSLGSIGGGLGPLRSLLGPLAAVGGLQGLLTVNREQQQATLRLFAGLTGDQSALREYLDLVNRISVDLGLQPGVVAGVVASIGTQFGLAADDPNLDRLTRALSALQLSGAGAADALAGKLGPAIGNFDISALEALGTAFLVSRETDIPLTTLLQTLINQSPRIAEVFPTFQAAALAIGLFAREGVPAERALIGFSTAMRELTREEAVRLLDEYRIGLVTAQQVLDVFGEEGGRAVLKLAESESWPAIRAAILGVNEQADMLRQDGPAALDALTQAAQENVDPFAVAMRQIQNALIGPASALGHFLTAASRAAEGDFGGAGRALQDFSSALIPDAIEDDVISGARSFFRGALGLFGQENLVPPSAEEEARAERMRLDAILVRNNQRFARNGGVYGPTAPTIFGPQQPPPFVGPQQPAGPTLVVQGNLIDREGLSDAVAQADVANFLRGILPQGSGVQ